MSTTVHYDAGPRVILELGIHQFGRADRTDRDRPRLRKHMRALVDGVLDAASVDKSQTVRMDLGDGVLVVVDPGVSSARLVHELGAELERLASQNAAVPPAERLRLRIVVHHGTVAPDKAGLVGQTINHTMRLLDAAARQMLQNAPSVAGVLLVSDDVYQRIGKHGYMSQPTLYWPIKVEAKETRTRAWVYLPPLARHQELLSPTADSASEIPTASTAREHQLGRSALEREGPLAWRVRVPARWRRSARRATFGWTPPGAALVEAVRRRWRQRREAIEFDRSAPNTGLVDERRERSTLWRRGWHSFAEGLGGAFDLAGEIPSHRVTASRDDVGIIAQLSMRYTALGPPGNHGTPTGQHSERDDK